MVDGRMKVDGRKRRTDGKMKEKDRRKDDGEVK